MDSTALSDPGTLEAARAWEQICQVLIGSLDEPRLHPRALTALTAVGGVGYLGRLHEAERGKAREKFIAAYMQAATPTQ